MDESVKTLYVEEDLAKDFQEWYRDREFFYDINWAYFGSPTGKTVVDFGCGDGSFLKASLAKGISFGLGLDISQPMINNESNVVKYDLDNASGQLRFAAADCFEPLRDDYGQFDFASCQFILHSCGSEKELQIFFKNIFQILKPGGKAFIANSPMMKTRKDQETMENLLGTTPPLISDANGQDPFFAQSPAYRPTDLVSDWGTAYTRDIMFQFSAYYWTTEKLMKNLKEIGFINVELLRPSSGNDKSIKAEQLDALEEPFVLIGAEKEAP